MSHEHLTGDGFYVSYAEATEDEPDETALVEEEPMPFGHYPQGLLDRWYILAGDHRAEYEPRIKMGFAACFEYFTANQDQEIQRAGRPTNQPKRDGEKI